MPQLTEKAFALAEEVGYDPFLKYMTLEPGVGDTLEKIRLAGVKTAISTNRSTTMPRLVEIFGLDRWFDMIVSALDVSRPKPHPEGVEKILKKTGVSKDRAIYIGDSVIDKETANNSGLPLIAYKNPLLKGEFHVKRFPEIASIVLTGNSKTS